jgi:TonB-linked SusC/RagA family outer membrane protein
MTDELKRLLFCLLLFAGSLGASAEMTEKRISIKGENLSLREIFRIIEKQSGYQFFYNSNLLEKLRPVTLNVLNVPVEQVMDICCRDQPVHYRIVDRIIILEEKKSPAGVTAPPVKASAAETPVKGRVTNKEGEPMAGVTVTDKRSQAAVRTQADGTFSINANAGDMLRFTFVGYETVEVRIKARQETLKIDMVEAVKTLDETVVIAYGTTTARANTGSVSRVKGSDIANTPVQSFDAALAGRATGVNITATSGVVNQAPVFRIRGTNSLSLSSYPLIVIDGVPAYTDNVGVGSNAMNNPLSAINPNDIESIDIAKDAAATSLYGSRAANGVVFVTTKKGRAGKAKLTYNGSVAFSKAVRTADILDGDQYLEIKNEGLVNAGTYDAVKNYYGNSIGPDGKVVRTNWFDYIFRRGLTYTNSISVSGASETTKYYASVGYTRQQGILKSNDYNRKSVLFNFEHKVGSWLTVGNRTNYANDLTGSKLSTGQGATNTAANSVAYRMALISAPIIGPYNKDGSFNATGLNLGLMDNQGHLTSTARMGYTNPVITLTFNKDNTGNNFIQSNSFVAVKPIKGLVLKTAYGIDNMYSRTERYFDPRSMEGYTANGSATGISAKREKWVWTNTVNYAFDVKDHHFDILGGEEQQKFTGDQFGLIRSGQTDPDYVDIQGGFSTVSVTATQDERYYQYLESLFSRLQYEFNQKYQFSASLRRDQSSLLGKNNKSGLFWGFSGGWEVSKEGFWDKAGLSRVVNFFKLKASYGKVGNLSGIGDYQTLSTYAASLYGGIAALYFSASGNPDLKWETSKKTDVGIVFGLLDNRINGELSFYKNNIDGLIFGVPVPSSAGIPGSTPNTILSNVGKMYNKGIEIALNGEIIRGRDLGWEAGLNVSFNKNEITALTPSVDRLLISSIGGAADQFSISMVGHPVGMIYAIRTAGVDPQSGRRIFLDQSGRKVLYTQVAASGGYNWEYEDGTQAPAITAANDGVAYKRANPKLYGGFSTKLRYKQFDLDVLMTFQAGGYMYYGTQGTLMDGRFANNSTMILRRWQKPGDITDVPRLMDGDFTSWGYSMPVTCNVYSSDFLRMKNIIIGYNFSPRLLRSTPISGIRAYAGVQNAFILTPYPGADPEVTSDGNGTATQGFDRNMNPNARIVSMGLQVNF